MKEFRHMKASLEIESKDNVTLSARVGELIRDKKNLQATLNSLENEIRHRDDKMKIHERSMDIISGLIFPMMAGERSQDLKAVRPEMIRKMRSR